MYNCEMAVENKATSTNGKSLKVLLVDDEATIHELLELALKSTEYSLVSALNVDEAMKEITSSYPPDIVITDAMMPGRSGFTLIASLKSNPSTSDIPVILWTILEDVNGAVMDSSGKADLTMTKPFNLPSLLANLAIAKRLIKTGVDISFECSPSQILKPL
jgi:DNA-binding response OmpR family regulator